MLYEPIKDRLAVGTQAERPDAGSPGDTPLPGSPVAPAPSTAAPRVGTSARERQPPPPCDAVEEFIDALAQYCAELDCGARSAPMPGGRHWAPTQG